MQSIKEFKTAQNLSDSAFQRLKDRVIAANSGTPQDELIVYGYGGDRNCNMILDVEAFEKCLAPKRQTKRQSASDGAIVPVTVQIMEVDTTGLDVYQLSSINLNGALDHAIEDLQDVFLETQMRDLSNDELRRSIAARKTALAHVERAQQVANEKAARSQGTQQGLRLAAIKLQAMEDVLTGKDPD